MNLFKLFQSKSRSFYLFLMLLGLVSSLTNMGILMLINTALGGKHIHFLDGYNYQAFIALIVVSYLATGFFQKYMAELTNTVMFDLELSIVQKVRRSSFDSFEKMGPEKVYTAIGDTRVLGRLPEILVNLINASITIACSLLYLFWVSPWGGAAIMVLMVFLLFVYMYRNKGIEKDLNKVRDLQDTYYMSLRELLVGFRQIRISARRNNNLYNDHILLNRSKAKLLSITTSKKYIDNELAGVYSWYIVLGFVIFLLPGLFKVNMLQIAAFITTVLFMMSPVSQLVMLFPFYTSFKIAVERIGKIDRQLSVDSMTEIKQEVPFAGFGKIRFENVVYKYGDEDKDRNVFQLAIADFEISREEIIFITGGNGSGKTTFINILTGQCKPVSGNIFIDDELIGWDDFTAFSNNMAVVYTNHHLFRENYDKHDLSEESGYLTELTDLVNLRGILKVDRDRNWIDTKLSKGQQKRLALLLALLEDKPIIILDEWAAEQDPSNRKFFYTEWLQRIRAMGKTVIAVTHDDDFYDVADRVVKFNYGAVSEILENKTAGV